MPNFFILDEDVCGKQKMQKMQNFFHLEILLRNRREKKVKFTKKYYKNKPILCLNYKPFLRSYAKGVHISLFHDRFISKIPKNTLKTTSSHSLREVLFAIHKIKADFIFISPIFCTKSHEGEKTLGIIKLFRIINKVNFNNFILLGGMCKKKLKLIKKLDFNRKIKGFAGIRSFLANNLK